ncbi:MAG: DUF4252 domain-containing protein [Prevotellaceae bacterium]|jgi:hypothetical protein|nr:DUF4252 domain-containing protein [Prevotellaceae bacterium]
MQKLIVVFVLIFAVNPANRAQQIDKFMKSFAKTEGVVHFKMDGSLPSVAKMLIGESACNAVDKKFKSVEILSSKNADSKQIKKFISAVNKLSGSKGYEPLMAVCDGSKNVNIVLEKDKDLIKSVIIFVSSDSGLSIIRLKGKISESDISELAKQHTTH